MLLAPERRRAEQGKAWIYRRAGSPLPLDDRVVAISGDWRIREVFTKRLQL